MTSTHSWGRLDNRHRPIADLSQDLLDDRKTTVLPFGNGRSYGDSCHNDSGTLIRSRAMNRILSVDSKSGTLRVQSGVLLFDILDHLKNTNWILPVLPGTKFVTVGGAIANDIHGKNHHREGTFGCHVKSFLLRRSDIGLVHCSSSENSDLYKATIGGLGLTGMIVEAEISLMRVPSHFIKEKRTAFRSLQEFEALNENNNSQYSVSWVDSLATGADFGRGVFITGEHCPSVKPASYNLPQRNISFVPPISLINRINLKAFNWAYRKASLAKLRERETAPDSFFFPLDKLGNWNRLYGPAGLFQHQSIVPLDGGLDVVSRLLMRSQFAGHGSFLTVLKKFGDISSPGNMSFPRPGYTLTLDFPNLGAKTRKLLDELDSIVMGAGGRINPYKDARISPLTFQTSFPQWAEHEAHRDPAFSSNFWQRATARIQLAPPPLQPALQPSQPTDLPVINDSAKPEIHET